MIDLAIDSRVFIMTPLDEALQELDILFNTTNTELIGEPTFGTYFEQFLWQTSDVSNELRKYIIDKIQGTYFLSQLTVNVSVEMLKGEYRNIYDVKINVSDGNNVGSREYQIR